MKFVSRCAALSAAFGLTLGLAGCGERVYSVKGKVHNNGKILPVKQLSGSAGGNVVVTFYPTEKSDSPLDPKQAVYNVEDGTFNVPGARGNGIPAGQYKVAVVWQDVYPTGPDLLKGAFGEATTHIFVDVPTGEPIDINVAKPPTGK